MKYVSLHSHSTFSYMDGYGTPAQHVERVAELGMSALALTEHGNVSSHVQLEKAAKKAGVKPIFGLEAYMHPDAESRRKFHLTLLAADATGYGNLMKIVSRSWAEGYYQWPTVSGAMLRDHAEGIVVLSGCSDSLLACSLLGGKTIEPEEAGWDRAREVALSFQKLLGSRYFLECQMFPELERTCELNAAWEELAQDTGIPLVATADVHYPRPDDNDMQVILHAAGRGNNDVAKQAETWEYEIRLTYPDSDNLVLDRLMRTGLSRGAAREAAANTAVIADACSVSLPKATRLRYPLPEGMTAEELIWDWLRKGWAYRVRQGNRSMVERPEEYRDRVRYELDRIIPKDFVDYHLMISDLVRFAKNSGIPVGPARGSAAASLVCYLLRITEIDPMAYPLMSFERYIDPTREDEPDVDLDFDDERRHEVREYAISKYGSDRVGNLGTFTQYKGKNSIDDVARVHRVPKGAAEEFKGMIVERSGGDSRVNFALADTLDMFPAAKAIFDNYPDLYQAIRLEGNYRGMSTHAAGLVITNSPVADTCALYTRVVKGKVTQAVSVDKKDAEYLGLMKVDVLGLSTLGMIRLALEEADLTLEDLYRVPMDDRETLEAFRENDVVGIFQFEGRATRVVNREVKPDNFAELADINGLSRPGPLFSGTTQEYIDVKRGKVKPSSFHPIIDKLTAPTKGQIIYQEQVLAALRDFGGLSVTRVHEIRRIISQKLGEAQFNTSAEDFIAEAMRMHSVSRETASAVWGRLVTSATYSFNIAHCVSYSMLAFWCMWLKVHHPAAFYMAQLRKTEEDRWPRLIRDAEAHGVRVLGVTPGVSGTTWATRADVVVAGWRQLKGVGEVTAERIATYEGQITCADDLLNIKGIGPATLAKFRSQIDSADPFGLHTVENALNAVRRSIEVGELPLRRPTHNSDAIIDEPVGKGIVWVGVVSYKEYKDYVEDQRAKTGRSVEDIRASIDRPDLVTSCFLRCVDDGEEDVYVRATRKEFPRFKAAIESIELGRDVIHVVGVKGKGVFGASIYLSALTIIEP